jgi:hypothetical protein
MGNVLEKVQLVLSEIRRRVSDFFLCTSVAFEPPLPPTPGASLVNAHKKNGDEPNHHHLLN